MPEQVFPDPAEANEVSTFVDGVSHGNGCRRPPARRRRSGTRAEHLSASQPLEVREHGLANQAMERAASHDGETMVGRVMPEGLKKTINPRKN